MPEGDTVYQAAARLHAALAGHVLTRTDFRVPAFATVDLSGETVEEVVPRGKHLLMRVGAYTVHSHLKMEGAWHIYAPGERWRRPAHTARAVLHTAAHEAVGFSLGVLEVLPRDREAGVVGRLGPDLLGPDWDAERALANLRAHPQREIGLALLDQRNLAGLGNVYRAEVCFLRGVLPTRPVGDVDADDGLEPLVALAHRLIVANRDRVARVTTGNLHRDSLWVYGRGGLPCRRCGTRIRQGQLGDTALTERDVWWCPTCQR